MKVYHESEPHRGCTEEYVVKFWAPKPDGYMGKVEVSYFVRNSRSAHDVVTKRWLKDYRKRNVSLVSVTYQ